MTMPGRGAVIAALLVAAALAWWPWRAALERPAARLALVGRFVAVAALMLLLLDPGIRSALRDREPLVLLDNSVSMHATTGRADSASALAHSLGEVLTFAEVAPGEPGGTTPLGPALSSAVSAGRPLVVVTDGEVTDAAAIPADLLAQATVRLLARPRAADLAISDVRMPTRVAAGDTLVVEVDLRAVDGWHDSARVEVRDRDRVLLAATMDGITDRRLLRLAGPLPDGLVGERWLDIVLVDHQDAVPDDDRRLRRLVITPAPGVVMIAGRPDWDARFLYTTLSAVTATPVRGYVQLRAGEWRRMDDLRPVPQATVIAAARGADLLAVRGDTATWRTMGRARLLWPPVTGTGDWYIVPAGLSPLATAFAGIETDSLPPVPAVAAVPPGDWVALEARLARRGAPVPVVAGRTGGGRTVVIGIDGLHRWAFRGGESEQAWRTMIAEAASWLLEAATGDSAAAVPIDPVAQRGRPLRFRHAGSGAPVPVPVTFASASGNRADTLRFDSDGIANVILPPGRYTYRLDGGGPAAEQVAVEPFSDELIPGTVTLAESSASGSPAVVRRSLRDLLPLFALAVLGFGVEWVMRRRLGMR